MLSNSSKYALKAVLYLAVNSNESNKLMVKDVAKSIKVPQAYIAKLLQELSRRNVVSSTRGPKGGFFLSEDNLKRPLIDIITTIEGEKKLNACVLGIDECDKDSPCPLHDVIYPTKARFLQHLNSVSISEFMTKAEQNKNYFAEH